jgi:hypothetical protein
MSSPVTRPTFYEGEILPAADLVATVGYARDQMARHDRYLHSWGIAAGLALTAGTSKKDIHGNQYVPVTLKAGVAIDGTGREIVVAQDTDLNPQDFKVTPQKDPLTWYPVFIYGVDQPALATPTLTGACNTSQPTRTQEGVTISFGNP